MKIVQLSKNDRSGGAARAAYRLHQSLRLVGQHSVMVVESRTSDDPSVVMFEKPNQFGDGIVFRDAEQVAGTADAKRGQFGQGCAGADVDSEGGESGFERLTQLESPAWQTPLSRQRLVLTLHEDHAALIEDDRTHADDRLSGVLA